MVSDFVSLGEFCVHPVFILSVCFYVSHAFFFDLFFVFVSFIPLYFLFVFILFYFCMLVSFLRSNRKKKCGLCGRGDRKDLGRVEGGETTIRIYCTKYLFSIKSNFRQQIF